METRYTNEENVLILISLLKQHGIKKVVASPGTTNVTFVASIQSDPYFEMYSAVDERSAAYMACGIARETGEAVVLSCTGATASRNYIPALTEAYYKNLPILAVTSTQHYGRVGQHVAQVIDRTQQFRDCFKCSEQIYSISSDEDRETQIRNVNNAILELFNGIPGPTHINLYTTYSRDFSVKCLPNYRMIKRICLSDEFPKIENEKIGIYIGNHLPFEKEESIIDEFCEKYNAVVLCDQTSNYRGKYRFLANLVNNQINDFGTKEFDILIHIGTVSGAYITIYPKKVWRVNQDGIIRDAFNKLTNIFKMTESQFFLHYNSIRDKKQKDLLANKAIAIRNELLTKIFDLPFSNIWIAKQSSCKLLENSSIHFGILNSLRSWNFFETPSSVSCYSNTGGFGIDGCVSSLIGASIVNKDKMYYGIVGDLALFYDINSLQNRNISENMHLMIINNGVGTEFKNYNHMVHAFGKDGDAFMAAAGHNGNKSKSLIKNYVENLGYTYICAETKDEYLKNESVWINKSEAPVIFEIFTNDTDESNALKILNELTLTKTQVWKQKIIKTKIGKFGKKILKR